MDSIEKTKKRNKRPELLTLFCVLTFIGSGIGAFSNFVIFLSYDQIKDIFEQMEFDYSEFEIILAGGKRFFAAGFVLYFISLLGAIRMWNLRKSGFHIYTAAQIFILLLPVVTLESMQFSVFSFLLTVAFIIGYASQIKFME